jgi:uncharacterized protein YlxP (DUF503 family)
MIVGIIKLSFYIEDVFSLKDKRQIIKSIIERTKSKFKISIAEVGQNDIWNNSQIGISVVSNKKDIVDKSLDSIINFIEFDGRVEIIDIEREIIYFN